MSDFEIIDACDIDIPQRNRKPKYTTTPWEYKNANEEYQYYKALQRSYKRRHGDIETPYDHYIDQGMDYEKEMENVFPIQLHNIQELLDNSTEKSETSYCNICCKYVDIECISEEHLEVCVDCLDNVFTCTFCDETMSDEYMYSSNEDVHLCYDCSDYEQMVKCDYCWVINDRSNTVEFDPYGNKKTYCLHCLPEIERYRDADA